MRRNIVVSRERRRFMFVAPLWVLPVMVPFLLVWAVLALFVWTVKASVLALLWMVTTIAKGQADLRAVLRREPVPVEGRHRGE